MAVGPYPRAVREADLQVGAALRGQRELGHRFHGVAEVAQEGVVPEVLADLDAAPLPMS